MKNILMLSIVAVLMVVVLGCAPRAMVPPKINLKHYEVLGIIEFRSPDDEELGHYVTERFIEAIRRDQELVRIIELGSEADILKAVGHDRLDKAAFKAIGEEHEVSTIIAGGIVVSYIPADITLTPGFGSLSVEAELEGTLDAQMVETSTGASIWSDSVNETKRAGDVSIFGGKDLAFDLENPNKTYNKLLDDLIEKATRDFRVTWH